MLIRSSELCPHWKVPTKSSAGAFMWNCKHVNTESYPSLQILMSWWFRPIRSELAGRVSAQQRNESKFDAVEDPEKLGSKLARFFRYVFRCSGLAWPVKYTLLMQV